MTYNLPQIASILMEFRKQSLHPVAMTGKIKSKLGHAGFSEAVRRHWLEPDLSSETGWLVISRQGARLQEMQNAMNDPQSLDTGDQIEYVGRDGRVYNGVIRNVSPDKTKTTIAFTQGNPPDYRDGQDYDTKDIKVIKKTLPDARKADITPLSSTPVQPDQTYGGLAH